MQINWNSLFSWGSFRNLIDILIVWYILYNILVIIKGTRAIHLMKGIAAIAAMKFISFFLGLTTLDWIMNFVIQWGVVAALIVFQPEIRRGLEHIGRSNFFSRKSESANEAEIMINELNTAIQYMAKRRIGALISIEQGNSLEEFINTGIPIHSEISNQLITNIFIPNTPLHDGAMIIRDYHIAAAACYLPLSENMMIPKELGTRHRAAIGLSEVSDAITIIISEETGKVSVAIREKLHRELSSEELVQVLSQHLVVEGHDEKDPAVVRWIRALFKGGRSNG